MRGSVRWSAPASLRVWPLAPQWLRASDRVDPERGHLAVGRGIGAADRRFYADELIWWKRFNPADPSAPLSPLQSLTTALNSDYLAQQLNHAMLKNQARPDAVLTTQQPVPRAEARRIVGWWREALGRTDKSHRVIVLPHGLEYREIQRTLADIEYVRGREIARDEILAVYGVPPIMAGIIASGWGESEQVQRKLFWTDTVLTLCSQLDGLLTERGNELWPDNPPVFTRDLDSIESIIGQEAELVARYQPLVANGVMTINEMRGKLGLESVPWGDVWWSSMGLSPVSGPERPSTAVSLLRGSQAPRHLEPLALGKAIRRWPSEVKWPRQLRKARRDSTDGLIEQWIPETEAQVVSLLESWKRDLEPTEEPYSRVKWHEKLRDLGDEMIGSMVWSAWVREDEVLAQVMKSWFLRRRRASMGRRRRCAGVGTGCGGDHEADGAHRVAARGGDHGHTGAAVRHGHRGDGMGAGPVLGERRHPQRRDDAYADRPHQRDYGELYPEQRTHHRTHRDTRRDDGRHVCPLAGRRRGRGA